MQTRSTNYNTAISIAATVTTVTTTTTTHHIHTKKLKVKTENNKNLLLLSTAHRSDDTTLANSNVCVQVFTRAIIGVCLCDRDRRRNDTSVCLCASSCDWSALNGGVLV